MRSRSPASRYSGDAGAITAEFAIALPAVALVLASALAAIELGGEQLRLQEGAFAAARLLGRGESGAAERIRAVSVDAELTERHSGPAVCADVSSRAGPGILAGIVLRASACALDDAAP